HAPRGVKLFPCKYGILLPNTSWFTILPWLQVCTSSPLEDTSMIKRIVLGLFVVMLPSAAWAQTQENYLPGKSQLYFRFDGMKKHQAAYEKTAVGKMMQGETGKFLDELWKYTQEQILNVAQNEPKVGPLLKDFSKLVYSMHQNGLVFGLEVD